MKGAIKRAGWGIGDQAFSSLTNFAVGAAVARELGPTEFGAFSLAFATYLLILNISRAVSTEPLVVRFSGVEESKWRVGTSGATGSSVVVGVAGGVVSAVIGLLLGGALGRTLAAMGLMLPGLLLQDAWRFCFFAIGRPRSAFVNDAVWAVVLFPAIALLMIAGGSTVSFTLVWGGAAGVAAIAGIFQSQKLVPSLKQTAIWLRQQRDLGVRYLGEQVAMSGASQLLLFGVGAVAGLASVGALRGAQILLGVPYVLVMGIRLVAVPEAVRVLRTTIDRFRKMIVFFALGMIVTVAVCGLALLMTPPALGRDVFGRTWEPARSVLVPVTFWLAGFGAQMAPLVGLRALAAANRSLRARIFSGSVLVGLSVGGAVIGGVQGAAWGQAAGAWLGFIAWWIEFEFGVRAHSARQKDERTHISDVAMSVGVEK